MCNGTSGAVCFWHKPYPFLRTCHVRLAGGLAAKRHDLLPVQTPPGDPLQMRAVSVAERCIRYPGYYRCDSTRCTLGSSVYMKPERRIAAGGLIAMFAAVLPAGAFVDASYAAHSRVVFRATGKGTSLVSRFFSWPGGPMAFQADMNCASLPPRMHTFHARLVSKSGRLYFDFNDSGNGSVTTISGHGARFPAGTYRFRVTTNCTWTPWRLSISTYGS